MKRSDIKKVLVLGSGALKIGEAGEFDYSGSQAIKALKSEGIKTVLVNPNIATIQTSKELADKIYFVPVEPHFVEKVIMQERPDGALLSVGGQTALNCGVALSDHGVFRRFDVEVLGTPVSAIKKTEDRELFKQELLKLGLSVPKSRTVSAVKQAMHAGKELSFPLILRVAYALGGLGSKVAHNESELNLFAEQALVGSPQLLIEEYLGGWKEIEYEIVRDSADNCIAVCNMENFDPMGIHTGESIVVAPSQTLSNHDYQHLRTIGIQVIRALGIVGECNIQFALDPRTSEYRIIEVNARLSRSSALASKATGYPLAYVATKLALGYRLDELENSVTLKTKAFFEPSLDYVVVKIPRWDLGKFRFAESTIGSEMKSVGEVMGIGRTFTEAIQKGVRMLDQGLEGVVVDALLKLSSVEILKELEQPSPKRLYFLAAAIKLGIRIEKLAQDTGIDPWFLYQIQKIVEAYTKLSSTALSLDKLKEAKKEGFSDKQIGFATNLPTTKIRKQRIENKIVPHVKCIDTLAGEFPAQTNYLYLTYNGTTDDEVIEKKEKKKIIVLGSGPYRIGSSVEFDWCAVNTVEALKKRGYATIMVNCNPETVSTDYDYADVLYFEELSEERVLDIWEREKPYGIVLAVGGQTPNNLAKFCMDNGMLILGTSGESIIKAEDRRTFSSLLETLAIPQPPWDELTTIEDVVRFAKSVGYPVLARPSFVLSGEAMSVLYSNEDVKEYLKEEKGRALDGKVVVSKFMEGAREIDFDAVAANGRVVIRAISEHVEPAGVHSGDATLVLPSYRLGNELIADIDRIGNKIASALSISGPFNIQFLERIGYLMVIECNLRCSRSFPFVSKVLGINFMELGVEAMLGEDLSPITYPAVHHVGVKAPQFSFSRIKGADPVLRVEMASTGEVATLSTSIYDAFLKSLLATGLKIPKKNIFLSLGGWDNKELFFPYAKILFDMRLAIYATDKTAAFLRKRNISCDRVAKLYEGSSTSVVDLLRSKKIDLVINLTEPPVSGEERSQYKKRLTDGYHIRRTAIDYHVPLITNLEIAILFVRSLKEKQFSEFEVLPWDAYLLEDKTPQHIKKGGVMAEPIKGVWKGKDIISVDQFSVRDLDTVFHLARSLKKDILGGKVHHDLDGKIMAAIFYEPSSRTFGSFITAMQRLGGGIIPLQGVVYSSVAKGELLPDTVRTFASYSDVIVLRYPEEGGAAVAAQYSPIPVINAGDGPGEHPTQALLDLFTIVEHFKKPEGLTIGMVGDLLYGRTIHSLSKLLSNYAKIKLYFVSPDILKVKKEFKEQLTKKGVDLIETDNLAEVIGKLDVLYMTRVQKERFVDLSEYEKVKNYYILTPQLMKKAKKNMIVMHPFPRVGEISYDVDADPRAVYIRDEMKNGLFVRMALLLLVLGKKKE